MSIDTHITILENEIIEKQNLVRQLRLEKQQLRLEKYNIILTKYQQKCINKIDKWANEFGFKEVASVNKEDGIIILRCWQRDSDEEVSVYKENYEDCQNVNSSFIDSNGSGNDNLEYWTLKRIWKSYFGY